jgi:hypothetical protein
LYSWILCFIVQLDFVSVYDWILCFIVQLDFVSVYDWILCFIVRLDFVFYCTAGFCVLLYGWILCFIVRLDLCLVVRLDLCLVVRLDLCLVVQLDFLSCCTCMDGFCVSWYTWILYHCTAGFLGHLSHSGDLLLSIFARHRASSAMC